MRSPSTELVALCASILGDGEVSAEEAYELAEWLNNHSDSATTWPGSELIKPLQEIWADGKVNKRELHRLARLLISIQREWARHPATDISATDGDAPAELIATQLDNVRVPSVDAKFQVPSQSEPGRFYEVDLSGPSCTCPDWRTWRSRLPVGDLTRCCKHVLHVYAKLARREKTDGWLFAFIENGWPPHPGAEWHLITVGADKILFCTASEKGWANVFAKEGRDYARFGFNVDEDRWAYGSEPDGARAIASAICSCGSRPTHRQTTGSVDSHAQEPNTTMSPSRRMWLAAIVLAVALLAILAWKNFDDARPKPGALASPAVRTPNAKPIASVPIEPQHSPARAAATVGAAQPTVTATPAQMWTTRLVRPVRITVSGHNVVLPSGTRLRVLARSGKDVMVWYDYAAVTIPLSSTDLH